NNPGNGGFLDVFSNLIYDQVEAYNHQESIDLIYYFGEDENTIASPGANIESGVFDPSYTPVNWEYRNTTRYIKTSLDTTIFSSIQNDSLLLVSYIEGEGKRKAKNLVAGDVVSFKTQESVFGIFKVSEVAGTNDGTVNIDIIIQKK
ncbi:MAG: hypothetical protein K8R53_05300, partial [Bacteroidales bacterium]|nr:hypothetical protein [Bacteroidales bacterium]